MPVKKTLHQVKEFLSGRQMAYHHVFNPDSAFARRVLADLAKFCRANEPTFHADPRIAAQLDGRREVWLRIQKHTGVDPVTFLKMYGVDDA